MTTIVKPNEPFPAADLAVARLVAASTDGVVDVHPLARELSRAFPRHSASELSAAVITAIALRGATMRWHAAAGTAAAARGR